MTELSGDTVVVTGGNRGLGRSVAIELALAGAVSVVTGRNLDACRRVAEEILAFGGRAEAVPCDVADRQSVEEMMARVVDTHGRVTALVNNAGVIEPIARLAEADPTQWRRAIEVNLVGAYLAIRAVLPHFLEAGGGTIVNISSGAARRPLEGWSSYCTSKAGLAMLTRCLAEEYGASGLRAYGFSPGTVDTGMQTTIRASGMNEVSRLPRERLIDPAIPARVVVRLCREKPEDLNGRDLSIRDREFMERIGMGDSRLG